MILARRLQGPSASWEEDSEGLAYRHAATRAQTVLACALRLRLQRVSRDTVTVDQLIAEIKIQTAEAASVGDLIRAKELIDLALDLTHSYMHSQRFV